MSTNDIRDHRKLPVLFNVNRDASEKFPLKETTDEYLKEVTTLKRVIAEHERTLVKADPELNWCDEGVKV